MGIKDGILRKRVNDRLSQTRYRGRPRPLDGDCEARVQIGAVFGWFTPGNSHTYPEERDGGSC